MKPLKSISITDLSRVTGGILPLLGLIGTGASLAGQITGAIGQSKAKKAEALMAQNAAAGGGGGGGAGGGPPSAAGAPPSGPTGSLGADGLVKIVTNVSIS